jgi:hypothetical protein
MLGRKSTPKSSLFAVRIKRIAQAAPSFECADPAAAKREMRKPSFRPGTVAFMTGERLSVMVIDASEKGARVRFMRRGLLPERVQLIEPMQGINKWGYVAWQTAGEAGLRFVGARRDRA